MDRIPLIFCVHILLHFNAYTGKTNSDDTTGCQAVKQFRKRMLYMHLLPCQSRVTVTSCFVHKVSGTKNDRSLV